MSIVCAISGDIPETPIVSHVSGHVFEKRLLEKWVEDKGTDPVTNEPLSMEQTTEIKNSESVIRPRAPAWTSIPGILKCLQDEWDALMLHQYSLRDQLQNSRQELSHSLYQHDAACRVIARLQKDATEAKDALSNLRPMSEAYQMQMMQAAQKMAAANNQNANGEVNENEIVNEIEEVPSMNGAAATASKVPEGHIPAASNETFDQQAENEDGTIPLHIIEEIMKNNEEQSKSRKRRQKDKNAWPDLANQDEILNFSANFDYAGFHSSSYPGILSLAIDEDAFPGHILRFWWVDLYCEFC